MITASIALFVLSAVAESPVVEGDVTEAHVAGMTILVKRVPGAELVATQLYIKGGARNWSKADAGIEQLALQVATQGGTQSLDKIAFAQRLASLGAGMDAFADLDYSGIQAKAPLSAFESTFGLVVDAFLRPAMPAAEIELQRQQLLATIKHIDEDPDGRLDELVDAALFKNHPYANRPIGTLASVAKLTAAQLNAHFEKKLRETSRLVLIVVGDVDATKVITLATDAFAKVPKGSYAPKPLPAPSFKAATLAIETRKLPTNYIQGMFVGPLAGTPEYAAGAALTSILWERLFEEVRTKRNLSYAPGLRSMSTSTVAFRGIYVTAVDPNATLPVMFHELQRVKDEPLGDADLAAAKALSRTSMLEQQETTDGQATSLARGLLIAGNWRADRVLADRIAALSAKDIQTYAQKYFGKLQMVMLGDKSKLDAKLAKSF